MRCWGKKWGGIKEKGGRALPKATREEKGKWIPRESTEPNPKAQTQEQGRDIVEQLKTLQEEKLIPLTQEKRVASTNFQPSFKEVLRKEKGIQVARDVVRIS